MSDERLDEAIAQLVPPRSAGGNWGEVLARAHGRPTFGAETDGAQQERRYRSVLRDRRLIAAAAALALAGAAGASAFAIYGSGSSPGLTAGVSSLDRLPRPASLPDAVRNHLGSLAAFVGVSTADAVHLINREKAISTRSEEPRERSASS